MVKLSALAVSAMMISTQVWARTDVDWIRRPQISAKNETFYLVAEAEVDSPIENVLAASVDYNSYARKGVPTVRSAKVMSHSGNKMVVWFYNTSRFQDSTFFVNVGVETAAKAARVRWSLANISAIGKYRSNGTIESLAGQWQLTAKGANRTHITYKVSMKPKTNVPFALVRAVVEPMLDQQVTALFQILAN